MGYIRRTAATRCNHRARPSSSGSALMKRNTYLREQPRSVSAAFLIPRLRPWRLSDSHRRGSAQTLVSRLAR
jgi:hypothetical protein